MTAPEQDDGQRNRQRDVYALGAAASDQPTPTVNAGVDQTVTLPASLSGSTLTTTWTKVSGPGTVTFANAAGNVGSSIIVQVTSQ